MTAVFVAGSRAVSRLNRQITQRLDNIMRERLTVLVGDANGADKAVQTYLARHEYREVIVYCMESCRNNVGDWPTRSHAAPANIRRDRRYFQIKDEAMAQDSRWGFMLWDGSSKGTLANILNLLGAQKKVLLYLSTKKSFFTLAKFDELTNVLGEAGIQNVSSFLLSHGVSPQASLSLNRYGS